MDKMNELMNLYEQLSLFNDQLLDNPKMSKLAKILKKYIYLKL